MIKASQIASSINEIHDGVERSRVGKIITIGENNKPQLNIIAFQTYLLLLNSLIGTKITTKLEE